MNTIEGKKYENETVELDGNGFIKCSFVGCHLIFRGESAFGLREPFLKDTTMEFADHAGLTIQAIGLLYRAGGPFRQWVEHEIESGFSGAIGQNKH